MTYDPYKVIPAVLVAVIKDEQVLLVERQNTGYRDGWYALPGGHLEPGESLAEGAARELQEEVSLTVKPADLELFHIYHNDQDDTGRAYMGFIFRATKWSGQLRPGDDRIGKIEFYNLKHLPETLIPYLLPALKQTNRPAIDITFSSSGGAKDL